MRLNELNVIRFRNLESVSLIPDARFSLFVGQNAQGKTNLLEAISILCDLQGFRGAERQELIAHGAESALLRAYAGVNGLDYEVALELSQAGRKLKVNGKPQTRPRDYLGRLPSVSFTPEDVALTRGAPDARRRFLDRALFLTEPTHGEQLLAYRQWLKRRNSLLKDKRPNDPLMEIYAAKLAEHGAAVRAARARLVAELEPVVANTVRDVSDGRDLLTMAYATKHVPLAATPEEDAEALLRAINERLPLDLARGYTSIGPHVEDLGLTLNGHPAQGFASQGQHRTMALALKIAEIEVIRQVRGAYPLFLIDDLSSELDELRRARLFAYLAQAGGQVFLTSTEAELPQALGLSDLKRYAIEGGRLRPLDD